MLLILPAFLGRRDQLGRDEAILSAIIAAIRIHIERFIQRMRSFQLLNTVVSNEVLDMLPVVVEACFWLANMMTPLFYDNAPLKQKFLSAITEEVLADVSDGLLTNSAAEAVIGMPAPPGLNEDEAGEAVLAQQDRIDAIRTTPWHGVRQDRVPDELRSFGSHPPVALQDFKPATG